MAKKDNGLDVNNEVKEPVTPEEPKAPEAPKAKAPAKKSVKQLADEAERGVYGTGRERMVALGDRYEEVQAEVNKRYIKKHR